MPQLPRTPAASGRTPTTRADEHARAVTQAYAPGGPKLVAPPSNAAPASTTSCSSMRAAHRFGGHDGPPEACARRRGLMGLPVSARRGGARVAPRGPSESPTRARDLGRPASALPRSRVPSVAWEIADTHAAQEGSARDEWGHPLLRTKRFGVERGPLERADAGAGGAPHGGAGDGARLVRSVDRRAACERRPRARAARREPRDDAACA